VRPRSEAAAGSRPAASPPCKKTLCLKVAARLAICSAAIAACGGPRAAGPVAPVPAPEAAPTTAQGLVCEEKALGTRDVLAVVTWKTPVPGLELGIGRPRFEMWCSVRPGTGPTSSLFILGARGTTLRYLVMPRSPPIRWLEFADEITCDEGSRIEVQIETRLAGDGRLIFKTTASGRGCQTVHSVRPPAPFAAETWPPHDICCGSGRGFPWEE
jgi:hypothetical protein